MYIKINASKQRNKPLPKQNYPQLPESKKWIWRARMKKNMKQGDNSEKQSFLGIALNRDNS